MLVRQQNRFIAIMDNFNRVQEINNELMDAGGTLNQNYAKYLDSVEASANRATASFEEMWASGLDSDLIKDYYELMGSISRLLTKFNVFRVAIGVVTASLLLMNDNISKTTRATAEMAVENAKSKFSFKGLGQAIKNTFIKLKTFNTTTKQTNTATKASRGALSTAKAAMSGLGLATIGTEIAVIALQAALTFGLSIAISTVVGWIGKLIGSTKKANRELEQLAATVHGNISEYQQNIRSISQMKDEYEKLNDKLGENRDFTRLTADEQKRYNELSNEIANIAPEVVQGYTDKGDALIAYGTELDKIIDKEKELIEIEQAKLLKVEDKTVKTTNKEIRKKQDELDEIQAKIELYKKVMGEEDYNESPELISGTYSAQAYGATIAEQRQEMIKLRAEEKALQGDIDKQLNSQRELLDVYMLEMKAIEGLSTSTRELAKARVDKILADEGYDTAKDAVTDFTFAFEQMADMADGDTLELTDNEFNAFNDLLVEAGFNAEEATKVLYEFTQGVDETGKALAMASADINIVSEDFKELTDSVSNLDDVYNTLASGKNLKLGKLNELVDTYDEVREYIAETGDITLNNGEVIAEMRENEIAQLKTEAHLQKQNARIEYENAKKQVELGQEELKAIEDRYGAESSMYKDKAKTLDKANEKLDEMNNKYTVAASRAKALGHIFTETFRTKDLENFSEAFDDVTSKLDNYTDILEEIDKYGKLSGETNRKIMESHPELIHLLGQEADMRIYLTELMDEQRVQQQENYQKSLMATEAFSRKIFDENKALFEDISKLYDIDLDNFTTLQNLKMQMANQTASILSESAQAEIDGVEGSIEHKKATIDKLNNLLENSVDVGPTYDPDGNLQLGEGTLSDRNSIKKQIAQLESQIKVAELGKQNLQAMANIDFNSKRIPRSSGRASSATKRRIENIELLTDRYKKFDEALKEVDLSLDRNDAKLGLSTGRDRIALLGEEVELLEERKKLIHLRANEERKEQEELRNRLGSKIDLGDGSFGLDSFVEYTKQAENNINAIIAQINATSNDSLRDSLSEKKDLMEKAYDNVKEDLDRYVELQSSIPELSAEWWTVEYEKFNHTLDAIGVNYEKFEKQIDSINDSLKTMVTVRKDHIGELEQEEKLLKDISYIYEDSLIDIEAESQVNLETIRKLENQLENLGDIRNGEYDRISRRLIMARAEQDRYFEIYQQNVTALSNHINSVISNYNSQVELSKQKTIKRLNEIRKEMDGFDRTGLELSIENILADLDKIDGIFKRRVDFNLSTDSARQDLNEWRGTITETLKDAERLEDRIAKISKRRVRTEEDAIRKKEDLEDILEDTIKKSNELQDIEEDIRIEIEETSLEHQKIEDSLQNRIDMKQEELNKLQEEHQKEEQIRKSLEKQLEIMRTMDDTRYSYITGQGEETFTYDRSRVAELQKEIAQMAREEEKEKAEQKMQDEISKMQENLAKTSEINAQELEVLKLAQQGIADILDQLGKSIDEGMGEGIDTTYTEMTEAFTDSLKDEFEDIFDDYRDFWDEVLERMGTDVVSDGRGIDKVNLGDTPPVQDYTIQPNETLSQVADKFNTTVEKLMELNPNIQDADIVYPNQEIKVPAQFDTGGYTSDWGAGGKLAILHEKELVLNASDTANLLDIVNVARNIVGQIDSIDTPTRQEITNNENGNSIVLNDPVFQGVEDVNSFANELSNLYRDGIPSIG